MEAGLRVGRGGVYACRGEGRNKRRGRIILGERKGSVRDIGSRRRGRRGRGG